MLKYTVFLHVGIEEDFRAWRKIFWRKAGPVLTGRKKLTPSMGAKKGKKCEGNCKKDGGKCSSDEEEEEDEVRKKRVFSFSLFSL